jgi:hypothetical protein
MILLAPFMPFVVMGFVYYFCPVLLGFLILGWAFPHDRWHRELIAQLDTGITRCPECGCSLCPGMRLLAVSARTSSGPARRGIVALLHVGYDQPVTDVVTSPVLPTKSTWTPWRWLKSQFVAVSEEPSQYRRVENSLTKRGTHYEQTQRAGRRYDFSA